MKKHIMSVFSLIAFVLTGTIAFAQTSLPINSRAALRAYALTQASEMNASLYLWSGGKSGYDYKTWSTQKNSSEIADQAKDLKLSVDAVDMTDTVTTYVSVMNSDGDQLFYGYVNSKPIKVDGVWTLPDSAGQILLTMLIIPIKFDKAVSYAELTYKQSGFTTSVPLNVNGQKVYFSPDSAGLVDGRVRVYFTDGTMWTYDVLTGTLLSTTTFTTTVATTFKDVVTFNNPSVAKVSVQSVRGKGTVPTLEVVMSAARSVSFDVTTSDGKYPVKYLVLAPGASTWVEVSAPALVASGPQTLYSAVISAGTTYVVPVWDTKDFAEDAVPVQTGGTGKG